ncbi:hypothetical protein [Clostridium sp.]|uniref:hypothetical protein n=1 Tax=Clostridium sp. TaxID=1506 RepID=UPI002FCAE37D
MKNKKFIIIFGVLIMVLAALPNTIETKSNTSMNIKSSKDMKVKKAESNDKMKDWTEEEKKEDFIRELNLKGDGLEPIRDPVTYKIVGTKRPELKPVLYGYSRNGVNYYTWEMTKDCNRVFQDINEAVEEGYREEK